MARKSEERAGAAAGKTAGQARGKLRAALGIRAIERRRRLRDALIAAAETMIRADGLGGLRARDLARAANCAVGAIYNVFHDLDALVLAVNAGTLDRIDAAIGRAGKAGAASEAGGAGGATQRL